LVFVEESSTNVALTPRRHARAPKGKRAIAKAPSNWGKNA
jgi:hypothetical protein